MFNEHLEHEQMKQLKKKLFLRDENRGVHEFYKIWMVVGTILCMAFYKMTKNG